MVRFVGFAKNCSPAIPTKCDTFRAFSWSSMTVFNTLLAYGVKSLATPWPFAAAAVFAV